MPKKLAKRGSNYCINSHIVKIGALFDYISVLATNPILVILEMLENDVVGLAEYYVFLAHVAVDTNAVFD